MTKELEEMYIKLSQLKDIANHNIKQIKSCKKEIKKPIDPCEWYYASPKTNWWEEDDELPYNEQYIANLLFFRAALKATEKEIKKVKNRIKELQRKSGN